MAGGIRIALATGASLLALAVPGLALAEAAEGTPLPVALADGAAKAPAAPPARSQKLNPTGRDIALTVPAKDGAVYLGDMPLLLGADDSLSFPAQRSLQLLEGALSPQVAESLKAAFGTRSNVRPEDFAPSGIVVSYDPRKLELVFQIPVERRASRSVSVTPLDREQLGQMMRPAAFSAYLNIRSSVDLVEQGPDTGFASPVILLDGATRLGNVVAESNAIWQPGATGPDFQRLGSRLVYDDTDHLIRFSAGDLETQARGFQTAPDIAGVSIFRSYSVLSPQQIVRPRGDRTFRLDRPSTVEVLVNGQQVRRLQLAPGNYDLRDFPIAQGANDIRLNVLDDAGRTEVLRFNMFLDQTQLAKGLSEFGLYAGVKAPLGPSGPRYSNDWIVSGYYRRGISDSLTLGGNFQADAQGQMGGIEAVFGTAIGTFGTQAAVSHTKGVGDGYALQATFQRQIQRAGGRNDSFNLFFETRSAKFAPVTFFLPNNPYAWEAGGGYSHAFTDAIYAAVDARFSKGRGAERDVHSYRLSAGWRITGNATLTAEARYQRDRLGNDVSGFLSLTVRLGRYSSLRGEFDSRDNRFRTSYQTLHGSGVGSYNVTADMDRSDAGGDVSVNANYFANRAELGVSHFGTFTRGFGSSVAQRTTFRLGTSLALADDSFSIGRPIYDSFAVVAPHKSLGDADVVLEPSPYGRVANTGALRSAVMPALSSYAERTVPVDVQNAPPGTDIGQGSFRLFPAYRSGYKLTVGSDYNVTAIGTMLSSDGEPVSLVTGQATELRHPKRPPVTVFTNRQGRFGATGLAPGKWRIEMLDDRKSVFVIDIAADAKGIVKLGEIKPQEEH